MGLQGWYRDPYGVHDERWFSADKPTHLVRDHGTESYDEPPRDGEAPFPPEQAFPVEQPAPRPHLRERLAHRRFPAYARDASYPQFPPQPARQAWPSWTIWLSAVLTVAPWVGLWRTPIFFMMSVPVTSLAVMAQGNPRWRPAIAITLWVAFILSCVLFTLLLYVVTQLMRGFT